MPSLLEWLVYFRNLFVAGNQLVNAVAWGNPDVTISARVGAMAQQTKSPSLWYWLWMESVIDWCFFPIEGAHQLVLIAEHRDLISLPSLLVIPLQ